MFFQFLRSQVIQAVRDYIGGSGTKVKDKCRRSKTLT
jgi:hypothetical protein